MPTAKLIVDRDFVVSDLDRRLFGAFVEHMGRCVYTGIYEPGHPTADAQGFRGDVMDLTRELGPTIVRYPGGNFLSGYNWEDGVGPRDKRRRGATSPGSRPRPTSSAPTNSSTGARKADIEPMLGVNLGTHGPEEARRFVEYCNHAGGSQISELRRAHGW